MGVIGRDREHLGGKGLRGQVVERIRIRREDSGDTMELRRGGKPKKRGSFPQKNH